MFLAPVPPRRSPKLPGFISSTAALPSATGAGGISPLLANIYLHYVFDLWVEVWRQKVAQGDVAVVRYADDLVVGFESRTEAERFLREFRERLRPAAPLFQSPRER